MDKWPSLLNFHLDATVLFLLSSRGCPLDCPVFLWFSRPFFYKSIWNTLLSSWNPLGGKVPWGLGDLQSEQKPRQLPSPDEGEIETKSLGLGGK